MGLEQGHTQQQVLIQRFFIQILLQQLLLPCPQALHPQAKMQLGQLFKCFLL
jgi:hypothetical protein